MKRALAAIALALIVAMPSSRAAVPSTLNGLVMKAEHVAAKRVTKREYLTKIELYSLRKGKKLEATLEFGHFRSDAPVRSSRFHRSITSQLGTTVPVEQRLGGVTVYLAKAKNLTLASWFRERELVILSIRADYETPKSLIRSALELQA